MKYLSKGKVKPHQRKIHTRKLKSGKKILISCGLVNAQLIKKENLTFKF